MSKKHEQIQGEVMEQTRTIEQLQAELDQARAQNKALKEQAGVIFKVSEKRALSCYFPGNRFPTTLYVPQWQVLADNIDALRAFIEANKASLIMEKPKKAQSNGNVDVA